MSMAPAAGVGTSLGTTLGAKSDAIDEVAARPAIVKNLPPSIGAEQLIQWLFVQMRHSNKDVQACLSEVESTRERLDLVGQLQKALREMKTSSGTGADKSGDSKTSIDGQIKWRDFKNADGTANVELLQKQDWYMALGSSAKAAVKTFIGECNTADGLVMEKQVDKLMDAVKDDIASMQSNNELLMINLQHVMQTRNQAIQLASNLIGVIDRAADTPINHIGKI